MSARCRTVAATLIGFGIVLAGVSAAFADTGDSYGAGGQHSGLGGGNVEAWIDGGGSARTNKKAESSNTAKAYSGPSAYDLFDRYSKLMEAGKKAQALPVLKQAWVAAGCGKYDPKKDCGILVPNGKDPNPGPSPMQTVQQVVASVGYDSPQIGLAPNHSINHLTTRDGRALDSVVGYPNWFWAVGGTQTDKQVSKTAYGMKVTLSIHPDSLTVTPGDGTTLTCTGMGTQWTPKVPPQTPSPTCGHTYTKTGTYTVRMTAKWTVHYQITGPGVNVGGNIPVQGWRERNLAIGELQVVVDH